MKDKVIRTIRLLFIISLIISVISIRYTYAKYQDKLGTTYSVKMKGWRLKINNKDISDENSFYGILEPVWNNNDLIKDHVVVGKFVPGAEQYLLIIIDYSEVGVKFSVDLDIEQKSLKELEFFQVEGYTYGTLEEYTENVNDDRNDIKEAEMQINEDLSKSYKIHEVIDAPNLANKLKYIKIYLGWNDENKDGNVVVDSKMIEKNKYDTNYIKNEVEGNTLENIIPENEQVKIAYEATAVFTQIVDE